MKQKKERKNNKLFYLCKNKLDCIEMLISQAITDRIIDHDEFKAIIDEKKDYDSQTNIMNDDDRGKISEKILV